MLVFAFISKNRIILSLKFSQISERALFFFGFQASILCLSGKKDMEMKMSMGHWCDERARKRNYSEQTLLLHHLVQHKTNIYWP